MVDMAARMVSGVYESLEPLEAILAVCDSRRCSSSRLVVESESDDVAIGCPQAASKERGGASSVFGWGPAERA